jgi:hypothetical protein
MSLILLSGTKTNLLIAGAILIVAIVLFWFWVRIKRLERTRQ